MKKYKDGENNIKSLIPSHYSEEEKQKIMILLRELANIYIESLE